MGGWIAVEREAEVGRARMAVGGCRQMGSVERYKAMVARALGSLGVKVRHYQRPI